MYDEDLPDVRKFKSGDKKSFEKLYRKHIDEIYNFFHKRTNDNEDVKDLTQETFMRTLKSIKNFKENSTFRTWLFQIAKYVLLEHYREKYPEVKNRKTGKTVEIEKASIDQTIENEEGEENPIIELKSTDPTSEQEETKEELFQVISKLPADWQEVLVLRFGLKGETLSVKETATRLGKTEASVKMDTSRAIGSLRTSLTKKRRVATFKFALRR